MRKMTPSRFQAKLLSYNYILSVFHTYSPDNKHGIRIKSQDHLKYERNKYL